jgi:uncharacterized membrane protein YdjX (TVP38/TMEM64 family)
MFETLLQSVIQTYGSLGLLVVMIIQTIIAPIPSEALLMFAGMIGIDLFQIVIFGGTGLVIGSVIAFYISRIGGKPVLIKLIGEKWLGRLDRWVEKNGVKAIFFTRIIPIIPFDLISYISGITNLEFKDYLLATILGAFPRSLILALIGVSMGEIFKFIGVSLEITFVVGMIGLIVLAYLERKGYLNSIEKMIIKRITKRKPKN